METIDPTSAQELATYIGETIVEARDALLLERDAQIAAETEPLDAEAQSLTAEHREIDGEARHLESKLAALARVAQFESDMALLEGRTEEAQAKLAEAEQARNAPAKMRNRQHEITVRLEAIGSEKQAIARRLFQTWYSDLQSLIRVVEHGLHIELLDASRAAMYSYQERHNLGPTLQEPYGGIVKDHHLSDLTADERSAEWNAGNRWYSGRR